MKTNGLTGNSNIDGLNIEAIICTAYNQVKWKYDQLNCEEKAIDTIFGEIIKKIKQGFFALKFAVSCTPNLKFNASVFVLTTILSYIASFLTAGLYSVFKLTVIVGKIIASVILLIQDYICRNLGFIMREQSQGVFCELASNYQGSPCSTTHSYSMLQMQLNKKRS